MSLKLPKLNKNLKFKDKEASLPTLYKKTATGATQVWNINLILLNGNDNPIKLKKEYFTKRLKPNWYTVITTIYGQKDGKMQEAPVEISQGKNIDRSNETNVLTQGLMEMASQWTKQQERKGYSTTIAKSKITRIAPMLLHKYDQYGHRLDFPVYVEPKLDGVRVLAHYDPKEKRIRLWSRTGNEFCLLDHIRDDLLKVKPTESIYFDGELFSKERDFEEIVSICRKALNLSEKERDKQLFVKFFCL